MMFLGLSQAPFATLSLQLKMCSTYGVVWQDLKLRAGRVCIQFRDLVLISEAGADEAQYTRREAHPPLTFYVDAIFPLIILPTEVNEVENKFRL